MLLPVPERSLSFHGGGGTRKLCRSTCHQPTVPTGNAAGESCRQRGGPTPLTRLYDHRKPTHHRKVSGGRGRVGLETAHSTCPLPPEFDNHRSGVNYSRNCVFWRHTETTPYNWALRRQTLGSGMLGSIPAGRLEGQVMGLWAGCPGEARQSPRHPGAWMRGAGCDSRPRGRPRSRAGSQ